MRLTLPRSLVTKSWEITSRENSKMIRKLQISEENNKKRVMVGVMKRIKGDNTNCKIREKRWGKIWKKRRNFHFLTFTNFTRVNKIKEQKSTFNSTNWLKKWKDTKNIFSKNPHLMILKINSKPYTKSRQSNVLFKRNKQLTTIMSKS